MVGIVYSNSRNASAHCSYVKTDLQLGKAYLAVIKDFNVCF